MVLTIVYNLKPVDYCIDLNATIKSEMNRVASDVFLVITILSAPRPKSEIHLLTTIESVYDGIETYPNLTRVQVVNHFGDRHSAFYAAKTAFSGKTGIEFIEKPYGVSGRVTQKQRAHTLSVLQVADKYQSPFVMILEDDFPVCDGKMLTVFESLCRALQKDPLMCGYFPGTGGSSLTFRRGFSLEMSMNEMSTLIESDKIDPQGAKDYPHDVQLQDCLAGLGKCFTCKNHFYISPYLYFYHIGTKSSTMKRTFINNPWQCYWRHPLTITRRAQVIE